MSRDRIIFFQEHFKKPPYFPICRTVVRNPNQWAITPPGIEKGVYENGPFRKVHIGYYSGKDIDFLTSFTANTLIWFSKFNSLPSLTPKSFSHTLFLVSYSLTLMLTFSLEGHGGIF